MSRGPLRHINKKLPRLQRMLTHYSLISFDLKPIVSGVRIRYGLVVTALTSGSAGSSFLNDDWSAVSLQINRNCA